ncbi:MAG: sulfur transferase domain-containing protein [Gammaproteobacteria bacterium]|jgi:protein tyrosine phosphatase (PTP) superfamily phosphohydrolase (DUF442 family)|nr:sulfur transferase domain-containing protein [Gammaproteobacteria bacterium]MDP7456305.1 sulfur transferase domain-containing protein [Gammaproteobacteria bacterium]HJO11865.1 sulfur transferase domain-containing protein [Gammaproteobacteria bacterium]|tara:strand:+ start:7912 stop:8451 length:540 start_codon:yes stop_codon:yes gene_type:complete
MPVIKTSTNLLIALMLLVITACSQSYELDRDIVGQAQVLNLSEPEGQILASGQPTEEQLRLLADAGVMHVINLRPVAEQEWDEEALATELNMQYYSIPVAGSAGVTRENAQSLFDLLARLEGQPALVHCASSNRVGALVAISAVQSDGIELESAIVEGQRWGLTSPRLEEAVRGVLAAN